MVYVVGGRWCMWLRQRVSHTRMDHVMYVGPTPTEPHDTDLEDEELGALREGEGQCQLLLRVVRGERHLKKGGWGGFAIQGGGGVGEMRRRLVERHSDAVGGRGDRSSMRRRLAEAR